MNPQGLWELELLARKLGHDIIQLLWQGWGSKAAHKGITLSRRMESIDGGLDAFTSVDQAHSGKQMLQIPTLAGVQDWPQRVCCEQCFKDMGVQTWLR